MSQWRQPITESRESRHSTVVPVRISTVDPERDPDSGTPFYRSSEETTANLSRGGAHVRSWEPLAAGRRIVITIELPIGREIQLLARVAWTRRQLQPVDRDAIQPPGYGIEFIGGSSAELAVLEAYLESLAPAARPSDPTRSTATTRAPRP